MEIEILDLAFRNSKTKSTGKRLSDLFKQLKRQKQIDRAKGTVARIWNQFGKQVSDEQEKFFLFRFPSSMFDIYEYLGTSLLP
ncbi:hypothetical protein LEP1GSC199_2976 [Leptospira vanthielii serovar Holland str. Waz Holland = ATCC 700522]|uniref:Uncharacterized protein n=1 Tax=Leptospira vanthielii serovar Holland str. Waz Holland = ATCC 700522 TaxID=1218591 RepID=N1W4M7_9LEPT|nr:hypothetical protein LEP1GSC199_2976 [Leptospira vanthielii serovar Holland str. Waz Holland = ATCC 700522]